jgi:phosphoenolpyruvate carboxylase
MDKVHIFKTHFAALDIRQNHGVHRDTVEAILKKENLIAQRLDELGDAELIAILLREDIGCTPISSKMRLSKIRFKRLLRMKRIQRKNGSEGCNRYIISHAEDIFSVLYVFSLLRWCGWGNGDVCRSTSSRCSSPWKACKTPDQSCRPSLIYRNTGRISRNAGIDRPSCWDFPTEPKTAGICRPTGRSIQPKRHCRRFATDCGIQAIFFDGRGGPPRAGAAKPIASMRHMARILPIMPFNSPFKARRLPACMAPKRISSIIANSC